MADEFNLPDGTDEVMVCMVRQMEHMKTHFAKPVSILIVIAEEDGTPAMVVGDLDCDEAMATIAHLQDESGLPKKTRN